MTENFIGFRASHGAYSGFKIIGVSKKASNDKSNSQITSFGYRAIIITDGEGEILIDNERVKLERSSVIFVPPYKKRLNLSEERLGYLAIRFDGEDSMVSASKFGFGDKIRIFSGLCDFSEKVAELTDLSGEALEFRAKSLIYLIFSEISRKNEIGYSKSSSVSAAEKSKDYIDEHFTCPELSLKSIGDALSYHPNYISKVFNEAYGVSVVKYVNIQRVRHARFLMDRGEGSIKLLSDECGFSDSEYFSSVFKSIYGQTPRDYIKRIRTIDTIPD